MINNSHAFQETSLLDHAAVPQYIELNGSNERAEETGNKFASARTSTMLRDAKSASRARFSLPALSKVRI